MKIDLENIKKILSDGVPVEVSTSRFHHAELLSMAHKAKEAETELTLCGIEKISKEEYTQLQYAAKGYLRIKVEP